MGFKSRQLSTTGIGGEAGIHSKGLAAANSEFSKSEPSRGNASVPTPRKRRVL